MSKDMAPVITEDNGLGVASLLDLTGTKASVLRTRAEAKDYIDIDALITLGKVYLSLALSAGQRLYGSTKRQGRRDPAATVA